MTRRTVGTEAYYTSDSLAADCIAKVEALFPLSTFRLIIEPSAGEGAFYRLLPASSRVGIDTVPSGDTIVQADFLLWEPDGSTDTGRILTIGNPPFGARGSLAIRFIQHAAVFSDVIAFILPMSFNKDTFQSRIPAYFHLQYSQDCADSYLHDEALVTVRTVFQIWEKKTFPRLMTVRPGTHDDFILKHAHMSRVSEKERETLIRDYDFAIAQVGCNFAPKRTSEIQKGSHWFVKANVPHVEETFRKMDFSFLNGKNTAHMSLSKKDIVEAYITVLNSGA